MKQTEITIKNNGLAKKSLKPAEMIIENNGFQVNVFIKIKKIRIGNNGSATQTINHNCKNNAKQWFCNLRH